MHVIVEMIVGENTHAKNGNRVVGIDFFAIKNIDLKRFWAELFKGRLPLILG